MFSEFYVKTTGTISSDILLVYYVLYSRQIEYPNVMWMS